MKVQRSDFKGTFDNDWYYYCSKAINGMSGETSYIKSAMQHSYVTDISVLKAIRDFCPLEYLDLPNNKYFRFMYSTVFLNIFNKSSAFTNDFCIINIPQDIFCPEEANILTNLLRRSGINFGLVIKRVDTYTLCSEWKRQYITDESYEFTQESYKSFDNKFGNGTESDFKAQQQIRNEIEDKIIALIRNQIKTNNSVFGTTNDVEKNYSISQLISRLLFYFGDSPKMHIFIAEIYYTYGLVRQSSQILNSALDLPRSTSNTKRRINKLQELIKSKKPKDRFLTIEQFSEEYLETIMKKHNLTELEVGQR